MEKIFFILSVSINVAARKFRFATYNIKVKHPNNVSKGIRILIVNFEEAEGYIITVKAEGCENPVEVIWGKF